MSLRAKIRHLYSSKGIEPTDFLIRETFRWLHANMPWGTEEKRLRVLAMGIRMHARTRGFLNDDLNWALNRYGQMQDIVNMQSIKNQQDRGKVKHGSGTCTGYLDLPPELQDLINTYLYNTRK